MSIPASCPIIFPLSRQCSSLQDDIVIFFKGHIRELMITISSCY